jgi:hypothetical protein
MFSDLELTIVDPADVEAIPDEIIQALRGNTQELSSRLLQRIESRTPIATGALRESWEPLYPPSGPEILSIGPNPAPQELAWGRVYAQYQEGPPLGLPTYTNDPHQMLRQADPEDLPTIEEWADATIAAYLMKKQAEELGKLILEGE